MYWINFQQKWKIGLIIKRRIQIARQLSFFFVFSFLFSFNFAILFDIFSFDFGSYLFVFLVLFLKSVFGSLINVVPHFTDNLGDLCDFGIWIFRFNFVIDFFSEQEKSWKRSFRSRWLNKKMFTLVIYFLTILFE